MNSFRIQNRARLPLLPRKRKQIQGPHGGGYVVKGASVSHYRAKMDVTGNFDFEDTEIQQKILDKILESFPLAWRFNG
jgi:hypothetical protein